MLLVDADLLPPTLASTRSTASGAENRGLVQILTNVLSIDRVVQSDPPVKNLEVIASGPETPNPAELLARHPSSTEFLDARVREDYDTVIIDTPPLHRGRRSRHHRRARWMRSSLVVRVRDDANETRRSGPWRSSKGWESPSSGIALINGDRHRGRTSMPTGSHPGVT